MAQATSVGGKVLLVTLHSASGLKNMDLFGKSDPYCDIKSFDGPVQGGNCHSGRVGRTKTVQDCLDPVWQETHSFLLGKEVTEFEIHIMDEDPGMDDTLGKLRVRLDRPAKDADVELGKNKGSLHFSYKLYHLSEVVEQASYLSENEISPVVGSTIVGDWSKLLITVIHRGSNLMNADSVGKSDPYVKMILDGNATGGNANGKGAKTKVIQNNLEPEWNEVHRFLVSDDAEKASFTVYDEDLVGHDDRLGSCGTMLTSSFEEVPFPLTQQGTLTLSNVVARLDWLLTFDAAQAAADAAAQKAGEAKEEEMAGLLEAAMAAKAEAEERARQLMVDAAQAEADAQAAHKVAEAEAEAEAEATVAAKAEEDARRAAVSPE